MKRVTQQSCASVRVCVCYTMRGTMVIWWRKRGYWCILRWKVSLPSLYLCACVRVSLWASVHGHVAVGMLRWQMALLQCRATLANGADREKVGKEEEIGCESKTVCVRSVVKMKGEEVRKGVNS